MAAFFEFAISALFGISLPQIASYWGWPFLVILAAVVIGAYMLSRAAERARAMHAERDTECSGEKTLKVYDPTLKRWRPADPIERLAHYNRVIGGEHFTDAAGDGFIDDPSPFPGEAADDGANCEIDRISGPCRNARGGRPER